MPSAERLAELTEIVSAAEEAIRTAKAELRTAERAGVDIAPQTAQLAELTAKLKHVRTAYNV